MMWSRRAVVVWLSGLMLTSGLALAQEADPGGGKPRRPRRRQEGGPDARRAGGQRGPGLPFGIDIPELRQEMERHREEMRTILGEFRQKGEGLREKIRELREKGATREEIQEALKPDPAKAQEIAGKIADAIATHQEGLAKIIRANRDAVVQSVVKSMAQRMARRGGPGRRPGEDGDGPPDRPRRRGPKPDAGNEGAPDNF